MLTHRAATILGDIPPDWERELLTNFLSGQQGGDWGEDSGEAPIRVLRSTNFTDRGTLSFDDVETRYFPATRAAEFALRDGDLLLERSGGGPTQPVGRVGFVPRSLPNHWFSNFVQLLRPDSSKIDPEFLGWLLLELNRSGIVERLQHQTTQMRNLDFRDYLRIYLPKPRPEEQAVIARILRTASVALAAAEDRLTACLQVKNALMQQLFTQGIPTPHPRLKRTKIGMVPDQWELLPLWRLATVVSGIALNQERLPRSYPRQYLTVINVQRERLDLTEVRYMEVFPHEIPDALLDDGDIVVVEGHANASEIGRAALITPQAAGFAYQNHLFRIRMLADVDLNRLFLLGVLNSERVRRHWAATCNTSSGLNTINRRGLRRLLIQIPKPEEQRKIAELLTNANDNIDACRAEVHSLDRLVCSLLQNLLSGRVRVRV